MDRIINLLVSVNNNHFKRRLFFFMPLLTVLFSLFNLVYYLPEYPFNACVCITVSLSTIYQFALYRESHKRDLLCMAAIVGFFLCSVFSFIAILQTIIDCEYRLVNYLMIALLFAIFILLFLIWFSPRRYG